MHFVLREPLETRQKSRVGPVSKVKSNLDGPSQVSALFELLLVLFHDILRLLQLVSSMSVSK